MPKNYIPRITDKILEERLNFKSTRTAYDASGAVIEYGAHLYRASRYSFETTLFSA